MEIVSTAALIVGCAIALYVLVKILTAPIKWIFKLLLNAVTGFLLLFLVNYFGASLGVYLEPTLVNCLVSGFIGIPGVLILLAIHYLL